MGGPPKTPLLTVDVVIETGGGIVLIERANEPKGWALPGGFVDVGETVEAAAVREALEETKLHVTLTAMLGVYSDPARDPRGHTVSVAFVGGAEGKPAGADDAKEARVFPLGALPAPLCFDHATILADYRAFRETGERMRLRTGEPGRLDDAEQRALLRLARETLDAHLRDRRAPLPEPALKTPALERPAGAFVTLHTRATDELRGCVGTFRDTVPLHATVREMAIAAAENDPRFPPVEHHELAGLRLEISVLSPRRRVAGVEDVVAGKHGVWVEHGYQRGVLLPQVAVEAGWSAQQLVEGTCQKAGLPRGAWRDPETKLSVFEAEVFHED